MLRTHQATTLPFLSFLNCQVGDNGCDRSCEPLQCDGPWWRPMSRHAVRVSRNACKRIRCKASPLMRGIATAEHTFKDESGVSLVECVVLAYQISPFVNELRRDLTHEWRAYTGGFHMWNPRPLNTVQHEAQKNGSCSTALLCARPNANLSCVPQRIKRCRRSVSSSSSAASSTSIRVIPNRPARRMPSQ